MALKAIIVFALILCLNKVIAQKPEVILYNVSPPGQATFVATTNIGSENQDCLPESIKATYVCINEGTWIFYPVPAWEIIPGAQSEMWTASGTQECHELPTHLNKSVGSYRPAGDPDGAPCALNLYINEGYASNEKLITGDVLQLEYAFNSTIRTGSCNWQFYQMEDHEGFSECLKPDEFFVPNFTDRFGVSPGEIKSIKKGCDKKASKLNPNHRNHVKSS